MYIHSHVHIYAYTCTHINIYTIARRNVDAPHETAFSPVEEESHLKQRRRECIDLDIYIFKERERERSVHQYIM